MLLVTLVSLYPLLLSGNALLYHMWAGSFPTDEVASRRHQSGIALNLCSLLAIAAGNIGSWLLTVKAVTVTGGRRCVICP